jgi:uncharacterized membrane protein
VNARLFSNNSLLAVVVAAGIASPAVSRAADVKIENYSNDTIYVAVAYNKWKGNVAVEGWWAIKSNESQTFSAPNASDMYVRVEMGGKEVTFTNHNKFLNWPVESQRFSVSKEPDDSTIWVLKWGGNLENSHNIRRGGKLPEGWNERRFFRIGSENVKLEVRP